jgi:hypothetical protein
MRQNHATRLGGKSALEQFPQAKGQGSLSANGHFGTALKTFVIIEKNHMETLAIRWRSQNQIAQVRNRCAQVALAPARIEPRGQVRCQSGFSRAPCTVLGWISGKHFIAHF